MQHLNAALQKDCGCAKAKSLQESRLFTELLGWVEGLEPSASGATVRRSTIELYPPCAMKQRG
jgi:hypothetical protein